MVRREKKGGRRVEATEMYLTSVEQFVIVSSS